MKRKFYQKKRIMIPLTIGLALIFLGVFGALHSSMYQTTTNARVDECLIKFTPQINAKIIEINTENNSIVKKGEIIIELDGHIYKDEIVKLEKEFINAQKELKSFEDEIDNINAKTKQTKEEIEQAKINLENANDDYIRYKNEFKDGTVTKKDLENAINNLELAQIQYETVQKHLKETNNILKDVAIKKDEQMEKLKETLEELEDTKLKATNATIIAPKSGKITNLKAKIGDMTNNNEVLFEILPDEITVFANFKKLPNANFKSGQKATVKVYCDGLKKLSGEVAEILPEKKNYIPVKIKIENPNKCKIKAGSKVYASVKVE